MQTGKQQTTTNDVQTYNNSALYQDRATGAGRWQDSRLLRSCRQICDEARWVLHRTDPDALAQHLVHSSWSMFVKNNLEKALARYEKALGRAYLDPIRSIANQMSGCLLSHGPKFLTTSDTVKKVL